MLGRRIIAGASLALVVVLGVVGFSRHSVGVKPEEIAVAILSGTPESPRAKVAEAISRLGVNTQTTRQVAVPVAGELAGDAAVLTAEAVALRLLAQDSGLQLTANQWGALAAVTANIQAIRHAYEASIATASVVEAARSRIEIPAYAAAGDALRGRFHADLQAQLGEANAREVLTRLGAKLEGHFGGFGVGVQTLDIAGDPRIAAADLEVTRTVQYWNSVNGGDRLTTRRETYFPRREDLTGENWGPLLSVLAMRIAARTGS